MGPKNIYDIKKAKRLRTVDEEFGIGRRVDPQYEIDALRKLNTDLELKLMNLKKDFNNYKRNKEKEIEQLKKTAASDVIADLGEVIDAMWSAYKTSKDTHGISLLYTKLVKVIEENGGKVIDKEHEFFNDAIHEAVGIDHDDTWFKSGVVIKVLQPGLMCENKLIKAAKVIVKG